MSEPSPWAGIWIAEDIEAITAGVQSGSWVDVSLGVVGAGLDGLALVSDPVGALLQYGIAWLIEHVKPLSEALDWLAGDPGAIAAHAAAWQGVAASLVTEAGVLGRAVAADVGDWSGAAADAYRTWISDREHTLRALGRGAEAMAQITEAAGVLIGTVRIMVRDAVATVVSRLIVYAGELVATAGLAAPLVVEQVGTLCAAWAARIARWLRGLLNSLRRLLGESDRLRALIELLKGRLTRDASGSGGRGRDGGRGGDREPLTGRAPDFDASGDKGPLGDAYLAGVHDPHGRFVPKEAAIAARLAEEDAMVHARERRDDIPGYKNPDAIVRRGPDDPGRLTEFKTPERATSGAVRANIMEAGRQLTYHGGGDLVIDGRPAGLTEAEARRGYARAAGQARQQGTSLPESVAVILADGRIVELSQRSE